MIDEAKVGEKTAVNLWVQSFDAAVEGFGESGYLRNLGYLEACFGDGLGG